MLVVGDLSTTVLLLVKTAGSTLVTSLLQYEGQRRGQCSYDNDKKPLLYGKSSVTSFQNDKVWAINLVYRYEWIVWNIFISNYEQFSRISSLCVCYLQSYSKDKFDIKFRVNFWLSTKDWNNLRQTGRRLSFNTFCRWGAVTRSATWRWFLWVCELSSKHEFFNFTFQNTFWGATRGIVTPSFTAFLIKWFLGTSSIQCSYMMKLSTEIRVKLSHSSNHTD